MLVSKVLSSFLKLKVMFFFVIFFVPIANATNYYVDTKGNDTNMGTLTSPWRTITKAANKLVAGDTVYIRAGIYKEQIIPQNSGSAANGFITYAAYSGETVTLDGSGGLNWNWNGVFDLSNKSYLQISGLRIINSPGFGVFMLNSMHMRILNNYTFNTIQSGIYAENSDTITIDGNEVDTASKGGVGSQESISIVGTKNFVVSNNKVHGGSIEGIDVKVGSANGMIFGNTVYNMARVGIYVDAWNSTTSNIEIFNNTVSDSSAVATGSAENGIRIGGEHGGAASNIKIYNNVLYNIAGTGIEVSGWHETGYKEPSFSNISIYNNTTHNCGTRDSEYGGGIDISSSSATGIIIENNILSQNRYFPIRHHNASANVKISNNLIEKSAFKQDAPATNGTNAILGSPAFINVGGKNFHLQAASPAINSADSTSQPTIDFDLNARPQGGKPDIGAFEYISSTPLSTTPSPTPAPVSLVPAVKPPTVNLISNTVSITSSYTGNITTNAAIVKWTTNVPSSGKVSYGTDSSNLNLSASFSALSTNHSLNLTGLNRRTKYYYKITANTSGGASTTSSVLNFRTARR